jgi:proline iminopeptidase
VSESTLVATFSAPDGTELAYRVLGEGDPLVCLPGGPMRDSTYFGDLGGLATQRRLVLLDPRGTGRSAVPDDPASYRCDRQVDDVEALRTHLGLERMDLLGHSAGASLAVLYATRHPDRIGRLALVTPGLGAVGIDVPGSARLEVARNRSGQPWFGEAYAALEAMTSGSGTAEDAEAMTPFFYGRWDADMREYDAAQAREQNQEAARLYGSDGAFDPAAVRAGLATLDVPVLVVAGEVDVNTVPSAATEYAGLFPHAELTVLPAAGHFPWLDDAAGFASAIDRFLRS